MATIILPSNNGLQLPPPPQSTGASELVTDGFDSAQKYANAAFSAATSFLNQLNQAAANLQSIPSVDVDLTPIDFTVSPYVAPVPPTTPGDLELNLPAVPADPTLTPVALLDVGAAPQFTSVPPDIDFSFPAPTPLTTSAPLPPTLPDVIVPGAPTITLPSVPSLLGIDVPVAPLLNLPTFTAVLPDSPLAPDFIFAFSEPEYTSQLLTDLRAQLDIWVNGASTGLDPLVEQAIWERGRARENTALSRKIMESVRSFAQRGFTKPPGALALEISSAMQDSQNTLSDQSRDVMIKQADLEQSNRRFAFDQAWKVEEGLITYQNQIAQRSFEVARFTQQIGIDIYQAKVQAFAAMVQAYSAQVEAFKASLQAELAKLDIYKTELEGQKLIGDLNLQQVEIYKAQLQGVQTTIDVFKAQVDAANVHAQVNKTLIEGYAATVGAYAETVRAKAAEYQGYATQVQAQVSKIEVYKAQADAYNSQVQGFRATVDAGVAAKNVEIRIGQEVPLDLFKTRTEVYRTQVSAESERVGAVVKGFEAQTEVFSAEVQGETSRVNAQVNTYRAEVDATVAESNLRIEAARTNVQTLIQQTNLLIESIKGGAQVAAQLAAASLSSVNLSAQIGDHTAYNVGFSNSNSISASQVTSNSTSQSNSTSNSTSTANQTSTISSTGVNTNTNYNFTP